MIDLLFADDFVVYDLTLPEMIFSKLLTDFQTHGAAGMKISMTKTETICLSGPPNMADAKGGQPPPHPNRHAWPLQLTSFLFLRQRLLHLISNFGPPS